MLEMLGTKQEKYVTELIKFKPRNIGNCHDKVIINLNIRDKNLDIRALDQLNMPTDCTWLTCDDKEKERSVKASCHIPDVWALSFQIKNDVNLIGKTI